MCEPCGLLRLKGNFCPICSGVYRDDDYDVPMLNCDGCLRWVHATCEQVCGWRVSWLCFWVDGQGILWCVNSPYIATVK